MNENQLEFVEHHVDNEEKASVRPLLYDEQEKEEYHQHEKE